MHGRRQLVPWGVLLSQATSETHAISYQHVTLCNGGHTNGTASDKLEEGVDDGRAVCPESAGLHAGYNGEDNGFQRWKAKVIL